MSIKIFGIKNCDTMKKTFRFFEENGLAYDFIDFKKNAPDERLLKEFLKNIPLQELVNRRGTTFRKLSESEQEQTLREDTAVPLLIEKSSMIKRPIIVFPDGEMVAGFDPDEILRKASTQ